MLENNIIKYYNGILNYTLFLESIIYNTETNNNILNKNYIITATMGFISNIFLTIKEGIIEKKDNNFNILILEEVLEENISLIATKKDNGYVIDNYLFNDKETLIIELRNKIAHGNYEFDLENDAIILNINNNNIKININKLSCFVVSSLNSYLKNYKTNTFTRKMVINNKVMANTNKPILCKSELVGFIKKCKQQTITIKSKDKSIIPLYILKAFEKMINVYLVDYDDKELYNNISNFNKIFGDNYQIINESKSFKNIDYDTFVPYFLNIINKNITLKEETEILLKELERNENIENNKLNLLIDNLYNLIILQSIKENNSVDFNTCRDNIYNRYGNIYISSYTLVSSLIGCFNALLSYGKDNIYRNDFKYTNILNNGLDYSKLDLSLFNIELCNIDTGYLNELKLTSDAKHKNITKIDDKIAKLNESISKVKDINIVIKLRDNLNKLIDKRTLLIEEYTNLINEYNIVDEYIKNNKNYLTNERIIDGIRNSIAHGNYYIKYNTDINNSYIIFEDIYNGEITFKCNIKIKDFMTFLDNSVKVISNFFNNKNKTLSKVY